MSNYVRFEFLVYSSKNLKGEDELCFETQMPLATKECYMYGRRGFEEYYVGNQVYAYDIWWTVFYLCTSSHIVRVKYNVLPNADERALTKLVAEQGFLVDVLVARKNDFNYLICACNSTSANPSDKAEELKTEFIPITALSDTPEIY